MVQDFSLLDSSKHMLQWFADEPYEVIRESIAQMLNQQVPGTEIQSFTVSSEPHWLTGVIPTEENQQQAIVTRAGCAFKFNMQVIANHQTYLLTGVYTWVVNHLEDRQHTKQRSCLDLDKTLDTQGQKGALVQRIYLD